MDIRKGDKMAKIGKVAGMAMLTAWVPLFWATLYLVVRHQF